MDEWLIDLLATIDAQLVAQQLDPTDVHWSTRRRMAYEMRWPAGRQMEAHYDNSLGDATNLALLQAEMVAIKAAIPKETETP